MLSSYIISLLGGHWGGVILQTEVAISAGALLIFASNTAIIGSYHVFLALSRMEFFPEFILRRNKLRGTPHYSIGLATLIPVLVLIVVRGNINMLGDMYAFGLLGAFSLTCIGMDIVRYRQRKYRRLHATRSTSHSGSYARRPLSSSAKSAQAVDGDKAEEQALNAELTEEERSNPTQRPEPEGRWTRSGLNFCLGILTTLLVLMAWSTNLVAKPLATAFGGSVSLIGMAIVFGDYRLHKRKGRVPVVATGVERDFPGAVLAVLSWGSRFNKAIIQAAIANPGKKPVVFLYLGERISGRKPEMFRLIEPHLNDEQARQDLGRANFEAQQAGIECRFVYRRQEAGALLRVWQELHPRDTIIAAEQLPELEDVHAQRIRDEAMDGGQVMHLLAAPLPA